MESKRNPSLKKSSDFQNLREKGIFVHANDWLAISYMKNQKGFNRFGWTISKKIGKAVTRNRLKRWGKEFVRGVSEYGADVNVVFKPKGKEFYEKLGHSEFDRGFKRAMEKMRSRF